MERDFNELTIMAEEALTDTDKLFDITKSNTMAIRKHTDILGKHEVSISTMKNDITDLETKINTALRDRYLHPDHSDLLNDDVTNRMSVILPTLYEKEKYQQTFRQKLWHEICNEYHVGKKALLPDEKFEEIEERIRKWVPQIGVIGLKRYVDERKAVRKIIDSENKPIVASFNFTVPLENSGITSTFCHDNKASNKSKREVDSFYE